MISKEEQDFYEGVIYRANKKLQELEKELRQTKSNFKNSQTHSKNCYKKLKAKFLKLEKDNQVLRVERGRFVDSTLESYGENIELKKEIDRLKKDNQELKEKFKMLEENEEVVLTTLEMAVQENTKLKKALDILKERFEIESVYKDDNFYAIDCENTYYLITKEEYEQLKEVFGYE